MRDGMREAHAAKRIVLSPHIDDAALSIGGLINKWSRAGETTLVVTIMTADPPLVPLSPFADELHSRWGAPAGEVYGLRREEEKRAMARLGAAHVHLGLSDCIYRSGPEGFYYGSEAAIFGVVAAGDESLVTEIVRRLMEVSTRDNSTVYAPLAVGHHVDHQLVSRAARDWSRDSLFFYEDAPYAYACGAVTDAIDRTFAAEAMPQPITLNIEAEDVLAKIGAIGCYRSQLGVLFGSHVSMAAQVWDYSRRLADESGWVERLWVSASASTC